MEEAEKLVVLQESALREVHGIATANDVQLITLPSRLFEPINTIIVLLRSPLLAVGAVSYLFGKPENRRVVYLAPGASKTLYRMPDVCYGLVRLLLRLTARSRSKSRSQNGCVASL